MNYFAYDDYIGNWILDSSVIINKEDLLEEIFTILDVREEFDFADFDIMEASLDKGIEESELEKIFGKTFRMAKLLKESDELLSKIRNKR